MHRKQKARAHRGRAEPSALLRGPPFANATPRGRRLRGAPGL